MRFKIGWLAALLALTVVTPPAVAAPQWVEIGPNGTGGYLAFTPAKPSRLYVLPGAGQHVFRSDDRGQKWHQSTPFTRDGLRGNGIAADPRKPDTVYVAGYIGGGGEGYVLRSVDAGARFTEVLKTPSGVEDVAVGDGVVYASSEEGVHRSSDGVKWTLIPGSPADAEDLQLDGRDLFVAAKAGVHVIRGGVTTKLAAKGTKLSTYRDVVVVGALGGAVQLSADRGATWREVKGPWSNWVLFAAVTATGQLQVQTLDGHFVSEDQGTTWLPTAALERVDVYEDLGNFPDFPAQQVVYASGGVYTTGDGFFFKRIGVPGTTVYSLATAGKSLIAGTGVGSFRTTLPGGRPEWGFDGQAPHTIGNKIGALAARDANIVLRGRNGYQGSMDYIYLERSVDSGRTWVTTTRVPGNTRSISIDPKRPDRVYVGAYLVDCFYVSDDGGLTLQSRIHRGLRGVKSIAADPSAADAVWVGDVGGLFHSTDAGVTITKVLEGVVDAVVVDPRDAKHIVVLSNQSVQSSFDGGKTWGLAKDVTKDRLSAVTYGPDGKLYAGTKAFYGKGSGVLRSVDGGKSWASFGGPLLERTVESVLVSPDGAYLFAGTASGSVHRRSLR